MAIARDEVIGQIEPDGVQQSAEARALAGQLPVNRPPVDSQAPGDLFDRATAEGQQHLDEISDTIGGCRVARPFRRLKDRLAVLAQ